ncbi:hypothetical protein FRC19_005648 [Serendipita sp. 401]|nr:hypothetical protein FRC15_007679 [Serendipita sp. 397]KAG8822594.1 hypothetical protein FRC19_005648 [Serendipita sp. 401]KAG8866582.1 hypothetical protein FRC20_008082 [Serendipita sp. 405]
MRVTWFASTSVTGNDIVTVLTEFYFAVSQWVPVSLLPKQISNYGGNNSGKEQEEEPFAMRQQRQQSTEVVFDSGEESETRGRRADVEEQAFIEGEEGGGLVERERKPLDARLSTDAVRSSNAGSTVGNGAMLDSQRQPNITEKDGIILGTHNVSIVVPQFFIAALFSIILSIYEPMSDVYTGVGHVREMDWTE